MLTGVQLTTDHVHTSAQMWTAMQFARAGVVTQLLPTARYVQVQIACAADTRTSSIVSLRINTQ